MHGAVSNETRTHGSARAEGSRSVESPENYITGKFHPVHLGDVLIRRYHIFRKLGAGSQSTVWLARDASFSERRFVAVKAFGAKTSETEIKLDKLIQPSDHPGKNHVEISLDSFIVHGTNGDHFCKVLKPLGGSFHNILEQAFEHRSKLNAPDTCLGKVLNGDQWSGRLAKRACRQILLGLDFLHSKNIAHRDIQPANVCLALEYDLSSLTENEIQRAVWPADERTSKEEEQVRLNSSQPDPEKEPTPKDVTAEAKSSSDEDSDSSDSDDESKIEWQRKLEEAQKWTEAQWQSFEAGDKPAVPHSNNWNKRNFLLSRDSIELLRRKDGQQISSDEICYTVAPTPLDYTTRLDDNSRLLLVDLGFACSFNECSKRPLKNLSDFRPPELLLDITTTHKADIFSLGLLFWETVMLRRLIETHHRLHDSKGEYDKNRALRDFVQRLGSMPECMRGQWKKAGRWLDKEGNLRDVQQEDEMEYGPDDFEFGDIWHQAKMRKPLDMEDSELAVFVDSVKMMLQWVPEERPSTKELLGNEWFRGMK